MFIPRDVIGLFLDDGTSILYNVFARTSLALAPSALVQALAFVSGGEWQAGQLTVWQISWFSNELGLLEDPTRLLRDQANWPAPLQVSAEELQKLLCDNFLLVKDREAYLARFAPKQNLLDFSHFGNFHQQLGQHLMTVLRVSPADWWYGQKYLPDFSGMRDNLYKFIQEAFLEEHFKKSVRPGIRIVDIGCGVGYVSRMMAKAGGEVIGVDPNLHYIELAETTGPGSVSFHREDIGATAMSAVEDNWADIVFMSDALLFYFIPERPTQTADISILLKDIKRILKPNGKFWSVEPHGAFFLAPRLGDSTRPFTVLTEYADKSFNIVPSLSQAIDTVLSHGFALTEMKELTPVPKAKDVDERAYYFAREFPQWHFLEFTNQR